jgi:DNA adenine methylase
MTEYVCTTCLKQFKQKSHFTVHKARKTPCKPNTVLETIIQKKVEEVLQKSPVQPVEAVLVRPILKWVGGKTQILDEVLSRLPKEMNHYYEPFLGGGSVLLGVLSWKRANKLKIRGTIYASDVNANLIAMYKNLQAKPTELWNECLALRQSFEAITGTEIHRAPSEAQSKTSRESYYYWIRKSFNALSKEEKQSVKGSAMLIFLNKTCFRGVYREGPNGFNVPFGHYKNPGILDEAHLREVSALIQPVVFQTRSFEQVLPSVCAEDAVYLDPPYAPETDKSFVGYVADGFTLDQHKQLFKECTALVQRNASFLLSNHNVKLVRDAFPAPQYLTHELSVRRAIHSKTPDAKTVEVLIQPKPTV